MPSRRWEFISIRKRASVSIDFIVGLPTTIQGHDLVWVVVDILAKMYKVIPTNSIVKTPKLARLFVDQLY